MFVLMAPQRRRRAAALAWLQMRAFMAPQKDGGGRIPLVSLRRALLSGAFGPERFLRGGSNEVCSGASVCVRRVHVCACGSCLCC